MIYFLICGRSERDNGDIAACLGRVEEAAQVGLTPDFLRKSLQQNAQRREKIKSEIHNGFMARSMGGDDGGHGTERQEAGEARDPSGEASVLASSVRGNEQEFVFFLRKISFSISLKREKRKEKKTGKRNIFLLRFGLYLLLVLSVVCHPPSLRIRRNVREEAQTNRQ